MPIPDVQVNKMPNMSSEADINIGITSQTWTNTGETEYKDDFPSLGPGKRAIKREKEEMDWQKGFGSKINEAMMDPNRKKKTVKYSDFNQDITKEAANRRVNTFKERYGFAPGGNDGFKYLESSYARDYKARQELKRNDEFGMKSDKLMSEKIYDATHMKDAAKQIQKQTAKKIMGKGGKTVIICETNLTDEQLYMKEFLSEMDLNVRQENVEFQKSQQ